ncbi:protein of unknown function [Methanoculleus bourgensis]|uniref:Uncharacterized protein n=1 Tax=Methanoculleus bourgensis TaxID=83986 RepID=A0A0X3BLF6_9EURY|nr:protein of unknown function [Methanoculleus bourgensis]
MRGVLEPACPRQWTVVAIALGGGGSRGGESIPHARASRSSPAPAGRGQCVGIAGGKPCLGLGERNRVDRFRQIPELLEARTVSRCSGPWRLSHPGEGGGLPSPQGVGAVRCEEPVESRAP